MRHPSPSLPVIALIACLVATAPTFAAFAGPVFEGRINAVIMQGGATNAWLYTVKTNLLRVELAGTDTPNPVDILNLDSGALTLLFPMNHSFVQISPASEDPAPQSAGLPPMPPPPTALPAGIGPRSQPMLPPGISAPAMPIMPMPAENLELTDTGQTTNLLGYACHQYKFKQRWETMEIWATDQLPPFQPYLRNQPRRAGFTRPEDQWPALLSRHKLFPLLATLRTDQGQERLRFQIISIVPENIADTNLFVPPPDYSEIQPLPF